MDQKIFKIKIKSGKNKKAQKRQKNAYSLKEALKGQNNGLEEAPQRHGQGFVGDGERGQLPVDDQPVRAAVQLQVAEKGFPTIFRF
jgi:hypothetical protein